MTLAEYYKTSHWRKFRLGITMKDDCHCEMCGRNRWEFYKIKSKRGQRKKKPALRINIHHKHYDTLGEEKRSDVLALCSMCHDTMHALHTLSKIDSKYEFAYEYLRNNSKWEHKKRKVSEKRKKK